MPVLGTGICDVELALWCPGSIAWSSQISFHFLPINSGVTVMGEGKISRGCVQVESILGE